ncbi:diacylglycerol kinase family protein [Siphonobacter sp. SORGH_AS_0500]|uniref:diacylglycerol/lipid kinase family protein n=1 Tax=Siphonobacter sp. SORGH_AS_0500 TaxID=1864824 RepID=UPI002860F778|nr:diacylglycerol kinase family protein [Siphonobacter sp. SORGH_AS_0500]MDR6197894.1 diacylglycerol kinase (ATP) [Siphonobacter sp. SORGH_AS_0500]
MTLAIKTIKLIHNPSAGEEEHSERQLIQTIENEGYHCEYSSAKDEDWPQHLPSATDLLVVAGGDGTVRSVAKELVLNGSVPTSIPFTVLPLGTANNIAKTLGAMEDTKDLIKSWKEKVPQSFDVGFIRGLAEEHFFIEAFGCGLFPRLMQVMKTVEKPEKPEEELNFALTVLYELIMTAEARDCQLQVDGQDYSGKYILLEIMNIKSIGPNLALAPYSEFGDGWFELIRISEEEKETFGKYILSLCDGSEKTFPFPAIKGRHFRIRWDGPHVHADDEILENVPEVTLAIENQKGYLNVLA